MFKSRKKHINLQQLMIYLSLLPAFNSTFAEPGKIHLGLGIGQSNLDPESSTYLTNITSGHDTSYKVFAGYGINDFISLEGFYSDLGSGELTAALPPSSTTQNISVKHKSFGADLLFHFPGQRPGFSGFLKLGIATLDLTGGERIVEKPGNISPTLGLGLVYQLQNGIFLRGDYSFIDENTSYAALNLGKRFGVSQPTAVNNIPTHVDTPRIDPTPPPSIKKDTDADGVMDDKDNCPRSRPGAHVNQFGCIEINDSDKDGIYDHLDQCPDTPKMTDVDTIGCPIIQHLSEVLLGAYFQYDSDQLTTEAKNHLDKLVVKLKSYPDSHIHIVGHTDNKGTEERNLELSRKRANTVLKYLVTGGIKPEKMDYEGKGENKPLAPNDSRLNRAKNRRVELIVSDRSGKAIK